MHPTGRKSPPWEALKDPPAPASPTLSKSESGSETQVSLVLKDPPGDSEGRRWRARRLLSGLAAQDCVVSGPAVSNTLGACQKCRLSGLSPDLLTQSALVQDPKHSEM